MKRPKMEAAGAWAWAVGGKMGGAAREGAKVDTGRCGQKPMGETSGDKGTMDGRTEENKVRKKATDSKAGRDAGEKRRRGKGRAKGGRGGVGGRSVQSAKGCSGRSGRSRRNGRKVCVERLRIGNRAQSVGAHRGEERIALARRKGRSYEVKKRKKDREREKRERKGKGTWGEGEREERRGFRAWKQRRGKGTAGVDSAHECGAKALRERALTDRERERERRGAGKREESSTAHAAAAEVEVVAFCLVDSSWRTRHLFCFVGVLVAVLVRVANTTQRNTT